MGMAVGGEGGGGEDPVEGSGGGPEGHIKGSTCTQERRPSRSRGPNLRVVLYPDGVVSAPARPSLMIAS